MYRRAPEKKKRGGERKIRKEKKEDLGGVRK